MSPLLLLLSFLCVILASFCGGLTGFGVGIIFQSLWLVLASLSVPGTGDLQLSLSILVLLSIISSSLLTYDAYKTQTTNWSFVFALLPGISILSFIGTYALKNTDQGILKRLLGCVFMAFAIYQISMKVMKTWKENKEAKKGGPEGIENDEQKQNELAVTGSRRQGAEDGASMPLELKQTENLNEINSFEMPESSPVSPSESTASSNFERPCPVIDLRNMRSTEVRSDYVANQVESITASAEVTDTALDVESKHISSLSQQLEKNHSSSSTAASSTNSVTFRQRFDDWISRPSTWLALVAGSAGGFLDGAFGTGGPPVMIFFSTVPFITGQQIRSTYSVTSFLHLPVTIFSTLYFNVFTIENLPIYLLCPFAGIIGNRIGNYYHYRINTNQFLLLLQALILLSTVPLTGAADGSVFGWFMLGIYILIAVMGIGIGVALFVMRQREKEKIVVEVREQEKFKNMISKQIEEDKSEEEEQEIEGV